MFSQRKENSFPPTLRLRKSKEFTTVWKMGCKLHTPHFILLTMGNGKGRSRLGLTVSRKVGNAVCRNRVKRLLREYFRIHRDAFSEYVDLSIIAKRNASKVTAEDIAAELSCLINKG